MKTTLYALSGFACSAKMYDPLKEQIDLNVINWVAFDNWGMGQSEILNRKDYSLKELAQYHWSLIDKHQLNSEKDIVLVGTSMGGFLVQEMCMLRPNDVGALIFLCTLGPRRNDFLQPVALTEEGLRGFHSLSKEQRAFFATEATVHAKLKVEAPLIYQRIMQYRLENEADIEEQVEQNNAAVRFLDTTIEFEKIKHIPVLCLHGENDRFVNTENAELLKNKFIKGTKKIIPEADHFFFMEKSNLVAQEIIDFIKNIQK